jgi:hypothetical protein
VELTEFLLARIAEDEAVARAAEPGPWVVGTTTEPVWAPGRGEHWGERVFTREQEYPQTVTVRGTHVASKSERPRMIADMARGYLNSLHEPTSEHIARHDPARVLAECEAKRRIVEQYADYLSSVKAYRSPRWADAMNEQDKQSAAQAEARHRVAEDVVRLLALPYANHPDYDEAWRS